MPLRSLVSDTNLVLDERVGDFSSATQPSQHNGWHTRGSATYVSFGTRNVYVLFTLIDLGSLNGRFVNGRRFDGFS